MDVADFVTWMVLVIGFLFTNFWKPYAKGYAEEKGKRLATHEDMERVLDEVRRVTKEAESIKAQISSNLWREQWMMSERKQAYASYLGNIGKYVDTLVLLHSNSGLTPEQSDVFDRHLVEYGDRVMDAQGVAQILGSEEFRQRARELVLYVEANANSIDDEKFRSLRESVAAAARRDLGISPE